MDRIWEYLDAYDLRNFIRIMIYIAICCTRLLDLMDFGQHTIEAPQLRLRTLLGRSDAMPIILYRIHRIEQYLVGDFDIIEEIPYWTNYDRCHNLTVQHFLMYLAWIHCSGRSSDIYKTKSKQIPKCIKFHLVAEHGYIFDFHYKSDKSGRDPFNMLSDFNNTS